ncbi:MAG: ABC transporter permease [Betaproteobacteria bacterium]|nr:ABC transporter permease [Betaproteobacteria bacterium]
MGGHLLLRVATFTVIGLLAFPLLVITIQSFNAAPSFHFPPSGFSLRWYEKVFTVDMFRQGLGYSLFLALVSAFITTIVATASSYAIVRYRFMGRAAISAFIMAPLVVPELVTGLGLLIWILSIGWSPNWINLTLLHCLVILPYMSRVITASLQRSDPNIENAAQLLGAHPITAFVLVTVPSIYKGLMAALIFAMVMSLHNFTATYFLSTDRYTLPLAIYQYIRTEQDPAIASLSTLIILGAAMLVWLTDRWVGIERVTR